MKCERHPEEDAVGLCMACGRGVCEGCRVVFRGVVHCSVCVQEGRRAGVLDREVPQALPRGRPTRSLFLAGVIGAVLLFLGSLFTIAFDLILLTIQYSRGPSYGSIPTSFYTSQLLVTSPLMALGTILVTLGILGFYINYGQLLAAGVAGMLSVALVAYIIPPLVVGPSSLPFPSLLDLLGAILWGTAWVLTGVSFLLVPRAAPRERELSTATGTFWIVAGVLLGTVVGAEYVVGWLPFAVASFLTYRAFAGLPVPMGEVPLAGQPLRPGQIPMQTGPAIPTASVATRQPGREPPAYPDFPDAPRR